MGRVRGDGPRGRMGTARIALLACVVSVVVPIMSITGAPPAVAVAPKALINAESVSGTPSVEQTKAEALGFTVDVVSGSQWTAMTQSQFASYQVLIVGDPTCGTLPVSVTSNASTWAPVVMGTAVHNQRGNRVLVGTDPVYHRSSNPGADDLIKDGIAFAGALEGRTGIYLTTSCNSGGRAVGVLEQLSTGTGSWVENASPPCGGSVSLIAANAEFSDVQSSDLQGWFCSDHMTYTQYRSDWVPLAVATDTGSPTVCGTDPDTGAAVCGQPYIFLAGSGVAVGPVGGPVANEHSGSPSMNSTQCHTSRPVNCYSGDFWHAFGDLRITGRGPDLDLHRTYNSDFAATDGPLGYGWSWSYGMKLTVAPNGDVTVTEEGGTAVVFNPNGSGGYTALPRVLASLTYNPADSTYTFTRRKQDRFVFDATGRLIARKDLNDYTTTVAYNPANPTHAATITDPAGRSLTVAYTGSRITGVSDSTGRSVTYIYNGAGELADAVDVAGGHWTFTYDTSHRMLTMREPKYFGDTTTTPTPVTTNHYDAQGRVDWQSDPLGRATYFDYTSIPGSTKITEPEGNGSAARLVDIPCVAQVATEGCSPCPGSSRRSSSVMSSPSPAAVT